MKQSLPVPANSRGELIPFIDGRRPFQTGAWRVQTANLHRPGVGTLTFVLFIKTGDLDIW